MEKQKEVQKEYEEYQYMLDNETWKKELSQFKLFSSEKISKNPKVSIIIANYNNAPYLKKMMDSLVQQTIGIEQLQVMFIDDCSTDHSLKVIEPYLERYPNIEIYQLLENTGGAHGPRNVGIVNARGEYSVFLDADDYITPDAIELLVNSYNANSVEMVMAALAYDYSGRLISLPFEYPQDKLENNLSIYCLMDKLPMSLGGKLINKQMYLTLENTHDLEIGEDAFLTLQLVSRIKSISFIDKPIYIYCQREGSVMNKPSKKAVLSRVLFVKKVLSYFSPISYVQDERFKLALSVFVLNQYYAILIMGGDKKMLKELTVLAERYWENKKAVKFLPYWRRLLLSICFSNISFFSIILVRVIWGGRYFRRILLNGEYKQVYRK